MAHLVVSLCVAATTPTSATSEAKMTQLFVTDEKSKRRFLVDTGVQVSVTLASWADKVSGATGPNLQAANGSSIATYGSRIVYLQFGNRVFDARLTTTTVKGPLLGVDFLRQHNLTHQQQALENLQWLSRTLTAYLFDFGIKHGVKCFIPTKDSHVFARARRLAPDKLTPENKEFLEMEKMGIIQIEQSLGILSAHDT
ncbi:retrovirus-related Pol polyprotein [Elysia marginata]|uniref:Retrovirus-related Pol polyprotein n=1 Tax=Elysia marginata TaxID=1093978 RepID=A0AAV4IX48_9GAST|nr:retrovirus-related Pol polyprotein [Elysia marginata]